MLLLTAENVEASPPSPGIAPGVVTGVHTVPGLRFAGLGGANLVCAQPGLQHTQGRNPRRRSQGVFMLFVVVVGFRWTVVLLSIVLLSIILRNRILCWSGERAPATNVLRVGRIRRGLLEVRPVYSARDLRGSTQRAAGQVSPKLLTILARDSPLHGQVWIYYLGILRLIKLEFYDSLFPAVRELSKNQAWILVGDNLDQP